jgi:multiple sugar transport system permease protein
MVHYGLIAGLLLLMFVPIGLMISMSLRRTTLIYADFWGLPIPPYLRNYAVTLLDLWRPLLRTLGVYLVSISIRLMIASLAAYSFTRMHLWGGEVLYYIMVLTAMMIPGVISLSPTYVLFSRLGLKGTLGGLAVSYFVGQAFPIFLLSTFFRAQPGEIFESARVDGASEWQSLVYIAMPLARPILVTLAIMGFQSIYGDLIWPSLMLKRQNMTMMLALMQYNPQVSEELNRPDLGPMTAGYVFGSIFPLIVFVVGMRYYIAGLTSGAIKG